MYLPRFELSIACDRSARPRERFNQNPVDAEHFRRGVSGVIVVEPHRLGSGGGVGNKQKSDDCDSKGKFHGRIIQIKTDLCHQPDLWHTIGLISIVRSIVEVALRGHPNAR